VCAGGSAPGSPSDLQSRKRQAGGEGSQKALDIPIGVFVPIDHRSVHCRVSMRVVAEKIGREAAGRTHYPREA
jgi:hypothetical protein